MSTDLSQSLATTAPARRWWVNVLALLLWLTLQLGVLSLAAGQVRLSDHFPRPAEGMALVEMVVVQIAFSAMLAPILFRDIGVAIVVTACAWPMLQLAGLLSVASEATLLLAASYVTLWMIALAALGNCVGDDRRRLGVGVIGSTYAIGGAVLAYLRAEFQAEAMPLHRWTFGPIPPALELVALQTSQRSPASLFLPLIVFAGVALGLAGLVNFQRGRARRR